MLLRWGGGTGPTPLRRPVGMGPGKSPRANRPERKSFSKLRQAAWNEDARKTGACYGQVGYTEACYTAACDGGGTTGLRAVGLFV